MTDHKHTIRETSQRSERHLPAIAISRGIGIGRVVFLTGSKPHYFRIDLDPSEINGEIERLRSAISISKAQLEDLAPKIGNGQEPISDIFGVHLLILEENAFSQPIEDAIRNRSINAEWALKLVVDRYLATQRDADDDHIRDKTVDIEDVAARVLSALAGSRTVAHLAYAGAVIAARELMPSTILELAKVKPAGLVTGRGGWTSHASIIAREYKLPMVSGIKNIDRLLSHGDTVIIDAVNGKLILDPQVSTLETFSSKVREQDRYADIVHDSADRLITSDGTEIVIRANVDAARAYRSAALSGAKGIGLYRSESLVSRSGIFPGEDEQVAVYQDLSTAAGDYGVKIRTFDTEFDQSGDDGPPERNPSLGMRSIRLSLSDTSNFRTQIRAILRASAEVNNVDIMLPMISGVGEVIQARAIIAEESKSLQQAGIALGVPKLGAMIEVPSSVLTAGAIARQVEFLCLGTNDLVQYLLAVDRDNALVADWYETLHPAVITAISLVLSAASEANIPAVVCGEMAASPFYVPLLIGLGARELSMNAKSIPNIRRLITGIDTSASVELVGTIKSLETAKDIEHHLREHYQEHWQDLFPQGILNAKYR